MRALTLHEERPGDLTAGRPRARVAHLTSVHAALDGRIFARECRSLAREGFEVAVVAPDAGDRTIDGVRLIAVPAPRNRLERLFVTGPAVARAALRQRYDIFHIHDPELMVCGLWLRLLGKHVVYDAHEDVRKDVVQKRYLPQALRRPIAHAVEQISRLATRAFDATVVAVPSIAGGVRGRCVVVYNYPVLSDIVRVPLKPWRSRARAVIYAGSISETRGLWEMLAAISHSRMPAEARLTLIGTFDDPKLAAYAQSDPRWSRVEHLGWQRENVLWQLMADAKVGIVTLHPTPAFVDSMPMKLFEYMALGLPVVASDFPAWRSIIGPSRSGLLVDPMDQGEIAHAIEYLLHHAEEAEAMGRRGRDAVMAHYTWESQAAKLIELYNNLCR
jgi:glycosyltransferase involved in cell wall biosynthesis